jgi:hypothetical protein
MGTPILLFLPGAYSVEPPLDDVTCDDQWDKEQQCGPKLHEESRFPCAGLRSPWPYKSAPAATAASAARRSTQPSRFATVTLPHRAERSTEPNETKQQVGPVTACGRHGAGRGGRFPAVQLRLPARRSAYDALQAMRDVVRAGRTWVVDADIKSFSDRLDRDLFLECSGVCAGCARS